LVLIFLIFVALLGIGLDIGLALSLASQMVADLAVDITGLTFEAPWTEIATVFGLAFAMTLLNTWLPAVRAAQILPAEALRYE
jgi:ABC-type lipoprotein release transport system permease subunit